MPLRENLIHTPVRGREVVRAFADAMRERIEPVHGDDVTLVAELADRHPGVSARDLVHAAVMQRLGIDRIISADTDFDRLEDINGLDPARIEEWHSAILTTEEDSSDDAR